MTRTYTFRLGNVVFDIQADTQKEAIKEANDNRHVLTEDDLSAPHPFSRVTFVLADKRITRKNLIGRSALND